MLKRSFDVVIATLGLLALSPALLVIAALIKLDSRGPVIFRQERIGLGFRPFHIYKFRTMADTAPGEGRPITYGDDPRITRVGRILRALKLDELPQLLNVLKGDMSLVGPRPEVPRYVALFRDDYAAILRVRPGITDLASIVYRNESELLGSLPDPESAYTHRILPDKVRLSRTYLEHARFTYDIKLIVATLATIVTRGQWPRLPEAAPFIEKGPSATR